MTRCRLAEIHTVAIGTTPFYRYLHFAGFSFRDNTMSGLIERVINSM